MEKIDFSSIQVEKKTPATPDRCKLSFTTIGSLQTKSDRVRQTNQAVDRLKRRFDYAARFDAACAELVADAKKTQNDNAMTEIVIERNRVIRAHRNGGEALYQAVEEIAESLRH